MDFRKENKDEGGNGEKQNKKKKNDPQVMNNI